MRKLLPFLSLLLPIVIFFSPVFFEGKNPIPADTITGLYHPMRDAVADEYPNGTPYKNFLITDSVRQQYVWRQFSIEQLKQGEIPWWNPYNFSGTPHMANFQSASFYPLNLFFLLFEFTTAWNLLVIAQSILGSAFMYLYLRSQKLSELSAIFGSFTWIFSGFFVVWLEWNTAVHVALWSPLILLSIDHLVTSKEKAQKRKIFWGGLLTFSLVSQFYAGYPQPWLYLSILQGSYGLFRLLNSKSNKIHQLSTLCSLLFVFLLFTLISLPQLKATLDFSAASNRQFDQGNLLEKPDWFLPKENLIQIIAPDFLGNPATLNYWGIFNYTEFTAFIGIIAAVFVLAYLFSKKKTSTSIFFLVFCFIGLTLALRNPISVWQFKLPIPFLSSSQPSRWIVIINLCLAILAAFGIEELIQKKTKLIKPTIILTLIMAGLWSITLQPKLFSLQEFQTELKVSQRNLILPTLELASVIGFTFLLLIIDRLPKKQKKLITSHHHKLILGLVLISVFSGYRFAKKFTPFTESEFLYPDTQILTYLQENAGNYRYMTTDQRIMAPNINIGYGLATIEGYDPLYLESYGRLVYATEQTSFPETSKAFNRILTTKDFSSPIIDLLGVKYILTFDELNQENLELILTEGKTHLYENQRALPRAFVTSDSDPYAINQFKPADIVEYEPNRVFIKVDSDQDQQLVLTDSWYPNWKATVNGQEIEIQNWFGLRAIPISQGTHEVIFEYRYSIL